MTIQTINIHGERYVILPEREFLALRSACESLRERKNSSPSQNAATDRTKFAMIEPLHVGGTPASEFILRDRR